MREDIAMVACRGGADGKPTTAPRLCAFAVGDWLVTSHVIPLAAEAFGSEGVLGICEGHNPYSHPWHITHAPTGLGAHACRDLWRAIMVCEEIASAFAGSDPASHPSPRELLAAALERASKREAAVVERFAAYNAEPIVASGGKGEV